MDEPMTEEQLWSTNSDTLTEEKLDWLRGMSMFSSHAEWAFGVGALVNAYDRLRAENERYREALRKYGGHLSRCELITIGDACSCGFSVALGVEPTE